MMIETRKLILIPGQDSLFSEDLKLKNWFKDLGSFFNTHPSDNEFRGVLSIDNPDSLWNNRPLFLKKLDLVPQFWLHTENVGLHTYHVAMNLNTKNILNEPEINRVKVVRAAALLHDNGKRNDPTNSNHPLDSAQEVEKYLKWMDFNEREIKLCLNLIAYHDFFGKIINSQGKETVDDLVKICPTPEVLKCLLTLTIADVRSIEGLMRIPNIIKNIKDVALSAIYKMEKIEEKRLYSL